MKSLPGLADGGAALGDPEAAVSMAERPLPSVVTESQCGPEPQISAKRSLRVSTVVRASRFSRVDRH